MALLRPKITLTYAQTLDGTIGLVEKGQLLISGTASMTMTHQLRADHDAILVGIGTVLSDNPSLTVRLVEGKSPQIVIVDGQLRTPPTAKVLAGRPWIMARRSATDAGALEQAGATIVRFDPTAESLIPLPELLNELAARGVKSLMVEGGATILRNFLTAGLVDAVVVTIAPRFVGGVRVIDTPLPYPTLKNECWEQWGNDMVMRAEVA